MSLNSGHYCASFSVLVFFLASSGLGNAQDVQ
jgi:hypothetical protein